MKLTAPSAIGIALLLLGAGCGGTSSSSVAEDVNSDDVYVMLAEQNESGSPGPPDWSRSANGRRSSSN
jgi:hypothetical protein